MEIKEKPGQIDEALRGIIRMLVVWGFINVFVWFLDEDNRRIVIKQVSEITPLLWIELYGPFVIGEVMILLGFLSMLTFRPQILLFGGLSLLIVGIWNLSSKFLLMQALKQYHFYIEKNTFWYVLGVMQIILGIGQIITYSKVRNQKAEVQHSQFINWHFLLYAFESDYLQRPFYLPNEKGLRWSWGAFFMPELWFLWHEMWGVSALICVFEGFIGTLSYYIGFYAFLIGVLIARLFAAYFGNRLYYFRYGKWLKA